MDKDTHLTPSLPILEKLKSEIIQEEAQRFEKLKDALSQAETQSFEELKDVITQAKTQQFEELHSKFVEIEELEKLIQQTWEVPHKK